MITDLPLRAESWYSCTVGMIKLTKHGPDGFHECYDILF